MKSQPSHQIVGRSKMKTKLGIVVICCIATLGINSLANANEKSQYKRDIKCHVELVGGRDIIHYDKAKASKLKSFKSTLAGKKVKTYAVKGEQVIYKVNECVLIDDTFNSAAAKSADIFAVM